MKLMFDNAPRVIVILNAPEWETDRQTWEEYMEHIENYGRICKKTEKARRKFAKEIHAKLFPPTDS